MAVYVGGLSAVVLLVASLAILDAERGREGANIETFGGALWWSVTTVTTVGYGDRFPVTGTGRMIAVALMMAGIALIGVVTATLASWIIDRDQEVEEASQTRPARTSPSSAARSRSCAAHSSGCRPAATSGSAGGGWRDWLCRTAHACPRHGERIGSRHAADRQGRHRPQPRARPSSSSTSSSPTPAPVRPSSQIQACGVCHTDLHYREGGINDEFPFLLGHEAAGVVEAVGEGVTDVAPGDFVILNWRAVCGECRACAKGRPWYCFNTHNATQKMTLDGRHRAEPGPRHRRVRREDPGGRRASAPRSTRRVDAAAAGLLGCGVMAGFGAAINTGSVGRGDTVAVIGCGGVGNAAIAGARAGRRDHDHRRRRRRPRSSSGPRASAPPTPSTARTRTSSRRSTSSPAASAPTSSSTRSAAPRPTSRPSTPATWPAPSSSSACPRRTCRSSCR